MLRNIFPFTAADAKTLRCTVQKLPFQILMAFRGLISEGPDHYILIIRHLFCIHGQFFREDFPPVLHLCLPFLCHIGNLIVIRLHRFEAVQIQESRSQKHRFLIISGLQHTDDENACCDKGQEMFAAFHHFVHEQMCEQHGDEAQGKMHFNNQLVVQSPFSVLCQCVRSEQRLPYLLILRLHRDPFHPLRPAQCADVQKTLHQQDQQHQQITVKKGSGSQTIPSPFDTMSVEFQSFPVKCSEKVAEARADPISEKGSDPVRIKQRCKIFRSQIMFDQGIGNSRCRHYQNRADPPCLFITADPEIAGQSQKQQHIRPHQGQQYRDHEHGDQFPAALPFQIAHGQSVEQDQQAEADHLRHTGQHISDKQGIQAEQYRQDPQLFPGGLHQPDKYKHGDCQQHDIADHRRQQIPAE